MSRKVDFIINDGEEKITKTCQLTDNDLIEWIVRLSRDATDTNIYTLQIHIVNFIKTYIISKS